MKRLLLGLVCFILCDVLTLTNQTSLNTPKSFGKTHFIIDYDPILLPKTAAKLPKKVAERPPILDGSSAHLLDESSEIQQFFTSIHDISSIILTLLNQAEKSINAALFSLTDLSIADALIAASKRGVQVCVVMDPGNMKQGYSKGKKLIDKNISVYKYDPLKNPKYKKNRYESLMHHKFYVIDDKLVITGSANSTRSACKNNIENIITSRRSDSVEDYQKEFQRLKNNYCIECKINA